ncbi:hypothetical protein MY4038_007458 [Beauveria bassiana]
MRDPIPRANPEPDESARPAVWEAQVMSTAWLSHGVIVKSVSELVAIPLRVPRALRVSSSPLWQRGATNTPTLATAGSAALSACSASQQHATPPAHTSPTVPLVSANELEPLPSPAREMVASARTLILPSDSIQVVRAPPEQCTLTAHDKKQSGPSLYCAGHTG